MLIHEPVCYGRIVTSSVTQEWYETRARDARRRASRLRKDGYRVSVEGAGEQVTPSRKTRAV